MTPLRSHAGGLSDASQHRANDNQKELSMSGFLPCTVVRVFTRNGRVAPMAEDYLQVLVTQNVLVNKSIIRRIRKNISLE